MSALDDIRLAITAKGALKHDESRVILIGKGAMRAVCCDMPGHRKPVQIDGFAVVETDEFAGWEVVDKATPRSGKWPLSKR